MFGSVAPQTHRHSARHSEANRSPVLTLLRRCGTAALSVKTTSGMRRHRDVNEPSTVLPQGLRIL